MAASRKNEAGGSVAPLSPELSARLAAFAAKELKPMRTLNARPVDPILSSIQPDCEFVYRSQFEKTLPKALLDVIFGNESGLQTSDFREGLHAVRTRKSALLIKERKTTKTVQAAYSDDVYEDLPFVCDPFLSDAELETRLYKAIGKLHPSKQFGGCGYACHVERIVRTSPWKGKLELKHYHGIGD